MEKIGPNLIWLRFDQNWLRSPPLTKACGPYYMRPSRRYPRASARLRLTLREPVRVALRVPKRGLFARVTARRGGGTI